jgi:hypothetical protein
MRRFTLFLGRFDPSMPEFIGVFPEADGTN